MTTEVDHEGDRGPVSWAEMLEHLRRSDVAVRDATAALQAAEAATRLLALKFLEQQEGFKAFAAAIVLQPKIDAARLSRDLARFNQTFLKRPVKLAQHRSPFEFAFSDFVQFIFHADKVKQANARVGCERDQHIHVAVRPRLTATDRAEYAQTANPGSQEP